MAKARSLTKRFETENEFAIVDERIRKYANSISKLLVYVGYTHRKAPESGEFRERMLIAQRTYSIATINLSNEEKAYFDNGLEEIYRKEHGFPLPRETLDTLKIGREADKHGAMKKLAKLRAKGKEVKPGEETKKLIADAANEAGTTDTQVIRGTLDNLDKLLREK